MIIVKIILCLSAFFMCPFVLADEFAFPPPSNVLEETYANMMKGYARVMEEASLARMCGLRNEQWYSSLVDGIQIKASEEESKLINVAPTLTIPPDLNQFRAYSDTVMKLVISSSKTQLSEKNAQKRCGNLANSDQIKSLDRAREQILSQ